MWPSTGKGHRLGRSGSGAGITSERPKGSGRRESRPRRLFQDMDLKPILKYVGAFCVALAALYVYQGTSHTIETLDPQDSAKLKEVFFGNDTWAVLCQNSAVDKSIYAPFSQAARQLTRRRSDVNFAILNCNAKLPSGKNTIQRLDLNRNIKPIIFINTGAKKKPRQLFPRYMSSTDVLVKELESISTPQAALLRDTSGLEEECLSSEYCVLVLKGHKYGKREEKVLTEIIKSYGGSMKLAMVDSVLHEISVEKRLPRFDFQNTRVILFHNREAGSAEEGSSKKKVKKSSSSSIKAKAYYGDFTKKGLTELLDEALAGKVHFRKVEERPTISRRSSTPPSPPPSSSSPSSSSNRNREEGSSSTGRRNRREEEEGGASADGSQVPLSPEEEARQQAQKEGAIREAMEKERDDFISFQGDEGEEEEDGKDAEEDELDDVIDLDEI